jgi:hypothetical protein
MVLWIIIILYYTTKSFICLWNLNYWLIAALKKVMKRSEMLIQGTPDPPAKDTITPFRTYFDLSFAGCYF